MKNIAINANIARQKLWLNILRLLIEGLGCTVGRVDDFNHQIYGWTVLEHGQVCHHGISGPAIDGVPVGVADDEDVIGKDAQTAAVVAPVVTMHLEKQNLILYKERNS